jgi:hypothetical protein
VKLSIKLAGPRHASSGQRPDGPADGRAYASRPRSAVQPVPFDRARAERQCPSRSRCLPGPSVVADVPVPPRVAERIPAVPRCHARRLRFGMVAMLAIGRCAGRAAAGQDRSAAPVPGAKPAPSSA